MSISKKFIFLYVIFIVTGAAVLGVLQWNTYREVKEDVTRALARTEAQRVMLFFKSNERYLHHALAEWVQAYRPADVAALRRLVRRTDLRILDADWLVAMDGEGGFEAARRREGETSVTVDLLPPTIEKLLAGTRDAGERLTVAWDGRLWSVGWVAPAALLPFKEKGVRVAVLRALGRADFAKCRMRLVAVGSGRPDLAWRPMPGDDHRHFAYAERNGVVTVYLAIDGRVPEPFYIETKLAAGALYRDLWINALYVFVRVFVLMTLVYALLYYFGFWPLIRKLIRLSDAVRRLPEGSARSLPTFRERELQRLVDSIRRSAETFRQQREVLNWILDHIPAGVLIYQERIVYANRYALEHLGYTREEMLAMGPMDLVAPSTDPTIRRAIEERVNRRRKGEGGPASFEIEVQGKERVVPHFVFADTIEFHGRPAGIATFIDLSAFKKVESELRLISSHLPMFAYHVAGPPESERFVYASEAIYALTGYTVEEVTGTPGWWVNAIHPDDREAVLARQRGLVERGHLHHWYRLMKKEGTYLWVEDYVVALQGREEPELVGFYRDATRDMIWKFAHRALFHANESMMKAPNESLLWEGLCRDLVEQGFCRCAWVAIPGHEGRESTPGPGYPEALAARLHESAPGDAAAMAEPWAVRVVEDLREAEGCEALVAEGLLSTLSIRIDFKNRTHRILHLYGELDRWFDASIVDLMRSFGKHVGQAIDDLRKKEQLRYLSYHDTKTHLPNVNALEERLPTLKEGSVMAVLNIHSFSTVNLNFGIKTGDRVLLFIAKIIRVALAGRGGEAFHLGGDKFALLLEGGQLDAMEAVVADIRRRLLGDIVVDHYSVPILIEAGVAVYPDDCRNPVDLKEKAMLALNYSPGPSSLVRFHARMQQEAKERIALVGYLAEAIEKSLFTMVYQPVVEAGSEKPLKCEALLRLKDSRGRPISPERVVSVAEELGVITEITRQVVSQVFGQIGRWAAKGITPQTAINISAADVEEPGFVDFLIAEAKRHGVAPERVTLEITERTVVAFKERVVRFIARAKEVGFAIAIDDFGIAHSSLHEMSRLDFDTLKIDKSFVDRIESDERNREVVALIIDTAHRLGAATVAEGVENGPQYRWLKERGCDYMQGYYFGRPMEPARFEEWYNAQKERRGV